SSTAISQNGLIDILRFERSTPEPSGLTRTLRLKSSTRLTGTRTFIVEILEDWRRAATPNSQVHIKPVRNVPSMRLSRQERCVGEGRIRSGGVRHHKP